jgi:hypothetical protein
MFKHAASLIDGRALYSGDLVLSQGLAHDVEATRKRRITETPLPPTFLAG